MSFERVRQLAQGSRESTALVFRGEPFRDLVAARVEVFTKTEPKELQKQIVAAATFAPALSDALSALLTRYVELASSGDCGSATPSVAREDGDASK